MSSTTPIYVTPGGTIYAAGGPTANCTISACPIEYSVYGYRPSLAASGVVIAMYLLCLAVQIIQGWRFRTWGFMAATALGCLDEILGYVGRILLWQNPWNNAGFIMQIGLLLSTGLSYKVN